MKSWKQEKRERREAEWLRQTEAREVEERRVASLSMWERIEEADTGDDVKAILHRLAEATGLED